MSERPTPDMEALFGADNLPAIDAGIEKLMLHPATSDWLRQALRGAIRRDAVDALNDAEALTELLELRLNAIMLKHGHIPIGDSD